VPESLIIERKQFSLPSFSSLRYLCLHDNTLCRHPCTDLSQDWMQLDVLRHDLRPHAWQTVACVVCCKSRGMYAPIGATNERVTKEQSHLQQLVDY